MAIGAQSWRNPDLRQRAGNASRGSAERAGKLATRVRLGATSLKVQTGLGLWLGLGVGLGQGARDAPLTSPAHLTSSEVKTKFKVTLACLLPWFNICSSPHRVKPTPRLVQAGGTHNSCCQLQSASALMCILGRTMRHATSAFSRWPTFALKTEI